ncbi:hypothetical protein V1227_01060 [Lentzea sp. DG1S-22]|nr:hypothetical protein [Lentzea sp. DG1S-22]WVH81373.1 hypothetical protein V1227_01060 [Lentzea sp. DG1S-22]
MRSTLKYTPINGVTNSSLPSVRVVNRTSPNSPRREAAIWPLTMLGDNGVAS